MTVTVQVPSVLQSRCGGAAQLTMSAGSVRAVLDQIEQDHPDLYTCICDETRGVRRHVNVFVNSALVCRQQISRTQVASGDVLFIFQAVSGG